MISKKMEDGINKQINAELYSAYLYLSMSAYFESTGLSGFAAWMKAQALEEREHAMKFFDYLAERGGRILLDAIDKPKSEWKSSLDVFEEVYTHEQHVTSLIHQLVELAEKEKDHASSVMLQWYVTEQVEEEASASDIVDKLKMVGESGNGIFMMDQKLGQRAID